MLDVRKASSVTAMMRKAGITTGLKYTQTGYVRHGASYDGEGLMITRQKRSRYSGMEDMGGVAIYLVNTAQGGNADVSESLAADVEATLGNSGLAYTRRGDMYFIADEPEPEVINVPLLGIEPVTVKATDVQPGMLIRDGIVVEVVERESRFGDGRMLVVFNLAGFGAPYAERDDDVVVYGRLNEFYTEHFITNYKEALA